jgi:6-phosphogluconolactonase
VPRFDVLMLGVGEEGHVASIFPESPAAYESRSVVAVRGCPKPPPTRLTLTFPAIAAATDVWLMAAGSEKAGAVALALGGAGAIQVPAAGVHGRARTLWLLDRESAAKLPPSVLRLPIG